MARPYFWKYVDAQTYPGVSGVSGAQATMAMAEQWNNTMLNLGYSLVQDPRMRALHEQVMSGQEYDKELYEQLIAPITYDFWATNPYGQKQISEWHQSDVKAQQEALQKQKAEQERLRAEQEAKAREQQVALEKQRQAAEKARKDAEFKSALEAMNQRAMPRKGTEEYIGAVEEDPQDSAKKKKRRVGYDATKSTGVLGIPQTERKQLLGM